MEEIINIFKRLQTGLYAAWNDEIKRHEEMIIKLNTDDQQFNKGIREDGTTITPSYSPATIKRMRKPRSTPNLRDTGNYHSKYIIDYIANGFRVKAGNVILSRSFNLSDHLKEKYGSIEGITDQNFKEKILPLLLKRLKNEL